MNYSPVTAALEFIFAYRELEKGDPSLVKFILNRMDHDGDKLHIYRTWIGKNQDFGEWYLNLSNITRYGILKCFGLSHPDGDGYLQRVVGNPFGQLYVDAPVCITWPTDLLIFFYNHGIQETPAAGIALEHLPDDSRCYGNSANWGDYVLSLPEPVQRQLLEQLFERAKKTKENSK